MGFFSRIFNNDGNGRPIPEVIKFGRFAESMETEEQEELYDTAQELYENGQHKEAYATFFEYMKLFGGPAVKCQLDEYNDELNFTIIQGTKTVTGTITDNEVHASAVIAKCSNVSVALMRYLLGECSALVYSKFGIENNLIVICQKCPIRDMSPAAFKDMLSEISQAANSAAEFIAREFPSEVEPYNTNLVELPSHEVSLKVRYMREWIKETFDLVESTTNEGVRSIIILRLVFKVMYLISPEGALLNKFNSILDIYGEYNPDDDNSTEINYRMLSELEDVLRMNDRVIRESIYLTYAVFPVLCYRPFMELTEAVAGQLKMIIKFMDMRRDDLVVVACEYIMGSQLCRFGVHPLAYELFNVMWRTFNTEYFYGLGFREIWYNDSTNQLAEDKIRREIEAIAANFARTYGPTINPEAIDYQCPESFGYTFLHQFCTINQITD